MQPIKELGDINELDCIEYKEKFYRVRQQGISIRMLNGVYTFTCDDEKGKIVNVVIGPESFELHFKAWRKMKPA